MKASLELFVTGNATNFSTAQLITSPGVNTIRMTVLPKLAAFPARFPPGRFAGNWTGAGFNFGWIRCPSVRSTMANCPTASRVIP
ncbi:MAG TPA: hypothetical protein VFV96_10500 [Verrucomicrobiae bacterium]|nr:hypothetical protein [Verrucomicrobiae bacterium]